MDKNDLWIGDYVQLIKSGRIGRYEGPGKNGKLKIRIHDNKVVLSTLKNIHVLDDDYRPNHEIEQVEEVRRSENREYETLEKEIDLHMEKLFPSQFFSRPERILDLQIKAAKNYIEKAIELRLPRVIIIHGKGEGVLKTEIDHLLKGFDQVNFHIEANRGGATEVWFSY